MPAIGAPLKSSVRKTDDYKFEYVNLKWWENFDDDILSGYIEKAVLHNYDLKMASIAVDEYYQNVRLQFANELPSVTAGFAPALVKMPAAGTDWSFAVPAIAQYEVDIFLKNRDKTKSTKKLYEASQFDERGAYISIASAVGVTYINIVKLDKMIELQEQIVASRKTIYDLVLLRNREGLSSTADTVIAQKAYAAGSTDLVELKKQRDRLLNQLAVLIGENPETTLARVKMDDMKFVSVLPKTVSSEVITQRPDYLKAEKMVEKAGIDIRVARKEFLPAINLTGIALFNAGRLGSVFTTNNMIAALAAGAMLPLFTGGTKTANLKLKKHQYERILQDYYKTNITAIQEVNDALAAVNSDNKKLALTQEQLSLEKRQYGFNENRYKQGAISRLELIADKEGLLVMDKLAVQQKSECFAAYIGLYKAAGAKI
jgi:NodT family efflux transporter outer membrane factor (OMF) lipoprotein